MSDLNSILCKGYFPRELPPPFHTELYGNLITNSINNLPVSFTSTQRKSKLDTHSIPKINIKRRRLSLPNPVQYFNLSKCIFENWLDIYSHCNKSFFSKSIPTLSQDHGRAILPKFTHDDLLPFKASVRSTSKYVLISDISRFYPSVYTHSIPWALHTKPIAKKNMTNYSYFGNALDRWSRNSQDGQTIGIPIGPDTSLVLAEILLCSLDEEIKKIKPNANGFRYVDDYEFGFTTFTEAEEMFAILLSVLKEFELDLNLEKTKILKLPFPLELPWVSYIRNYNFRSTTTSQRTDLIQYFDLVFRLAQENPEDHVLKYAINRLRNVQIDHENWDFTQDFLFQCLTNETGTFMFVLAQLIDRDKVGYQINLNTLKKIINYQIFSQCKVDHSAEVAWALWASIYWNIKIDKSIAKILSNFNDSIVALLVLDAINQNLIPNDIDTSLWCSYMKTEELYGNHWLLSYEANVKGWLPSANAKDHVNDDQNFKFLKDNNVEFYDPERIKLSIPSGSSLINGFYPFFNTSSKEDDSFIF